MKGSCLSTVGFRCEGEHLIHDGQEYGTIVIERSGTFVFDEEISKINSVLDRYRDSDSCSNAVNKIAIVMEQSTALIILRVIWPDTLAEQEKMFETFDPVWDWLLEEREGILHVGHGGFHDKSGLIL